MKINRMVKISLVLATINVYFAFFVLTIPQFTNPVLYPTLRMEGIWNIVLTFIPLLIGDVVVILLMLVVSKSKATTKKVLILLILLVIILSLFFSSLAAVAFGETYWCSKTNTVASFNVLDPVVEDSIYFDSLTNEELLGWYKKSEVNDYSYQYYDWNGYYRFEISFSVSLTDSRFDDVYTILSKENVFVNIGDGVNGCIYISENYHLADNWEGSFISYDNNENTLKYVLKYNWE